MTLLIADNTAIPKPKIPTSFSRFSPFTNSTGVLSCSMAYSGSMTQIKAGVISFLFRLNAADAGVATTDTSTLTFYSQLMRVGNYSLQLSMPVNYSAYQGYNYTILTQSATRGSGLGLYIQHTSTASESYAVMVGASISPITAEYDTWYLIQAGVNWNDAANSFIRINGAAFPSTRITTSQTTGTSSYTGIQPYNFSTSTATTMSLDISSFCCSAFDTVQGATLSSMCNELYNPANGLLKNPSSYSWQVAMNDASNFMVNNGSLGGSFTSAGSLSPTTTNTNSIMSYYPPTGQRYSGSIITSSYYQYSCFQSTNANLIEANLNNPGLMVWIFNWSGTDQAFLIHGTSNPSSNWNQYRLQNTSGTSILMDVTGGGYNGKTYTYTGSYDGKTCLALTYYGRTAPSPWVSLNKNVQNLVTAGSSGSGSQYTGFITFPCAANTQYNQWRHTYFVGYWSSTTVSNNPGINWSNGSIMTSYFLKADGQTIVDDPWNAIPGTTPLYGFDPNYSSAYGIRVASSISSYPLMFDASVTTTNFTKKKLRTTPLVIGAA
jgi:hypothetical protein